MEDFDAMVGPAVVESMEQIQTTSVDGRTYASIEDLLMFVHAGLDIAEEQVMVHALVGSEAGLAAASMNGLVFGLFDRLLHALDDSEGLESLSPGDFTEGD